MANYTVNRSKHATLAATTADKVRFSSKPRVVEVRNLDSTAVIFFRTDGTAPTVSGDDTDRPGPGETLQVDAANVDPPQVQLISSGARCSKMVRLPPTTPTSCSTALHAFIARSRRQGVRLDRRHDPRLPERRLSRLPRRLPLSRNSRRGVQLGSVRCGVATGETA
jgi:hypothetical protein